jgi:hypothetical protein
MRFLHFDAGLHLLYILVTELERWQRKSTSDHDSAIKKVVHNVHKFHFTWVSLWYFSLLLNLARPCGSTRWLYRPCGSTQWLDRSGFNKKPAGATARPNPSDPAGRPMTRANPGENRCFVFFSFKYGIWNPLIYIYIYSQEKSHVFLMWDKKYFGLNTST